MVASKAVASSVKTPGLWLTVDLLGAAGAAGAIALRALLMAPIDTDGTLAANTETRHLGGAPDAATAFGRGGQGHLAARALFKNYPLADVTAIGAAPSGGVAATGTWTATGPATGDTAWILDCAGREVEVPWASGESADTFKTRAISYFNLLANAQDGDSLPAIASTGGVGIITGTANYAGTWGNDITYGARLAPGQTAKGTAITIAGGGTNGNFANGTVEPDFSTALATVATTEYDLIVPCLSNAVVKAATGDAEDVETHLETYQAGLDALLQFAILGFTGSQADAKTGAASRNSEVMEYIHFLNAQSLPCEVAGAEAGDQLKWHGLRANYNRIGNALAGLRGPKDTVGDKPTAAELEDLLRNGVAAMSLRRDGTPYVVRPITTHFQDANGAPDFRAYDVSDVRGMYYVAKDLRTAIPQEFTNASISADLPDGSDPLPPGVVEIRDVKGFVVSRLLQHARAGIVDRTRLLEAISSGELVVEIDDSDPTQVNIFLPTKIIPPLAKIGVVVSRAA